MASLQVLTTPLPFPTLPFYVPPKEQRNSVQRNWYIIVIVLHVVFLGLFIGLLVYYVWFVKTPGKWLTEERIREDGLSEWDATSDDEEESTTSDSTSAGSFDNTDSDSEEDGSGEERSSSDDNTDHDERRHRR